MKRWKLTLLIAVPAAAVLLLLGWLLLPAEDAPAKLPVTDSANTETYRFCYVTRGDLEQWASITCKFQSLQQEHLRFPVDGRVIGKINVEVGDNVKKGQLLAELENEGLDDRLEAAEKEVDRLEKELGFAKESLEIVRWSELYDQTEDYEKTVTQLEEDCELAQKRLEELQKQKQGECLYAGIDGTVTFARESTISDADVDTIVISDRGAACFYSDTEYYQAMQPGLEVTLITDEGELPAVVAAAADLGFEEPKAAKNGRCRVYFLPKGPTSMMNDASQAKLELLLDSRRDVLIVPEQAVLYAGGQAYAFYENENGVREAKPVEVGLLVSNQYEVLGGLEEGEALIVK